MESGFKKMEVPRTRYSTMPKVPAPAMVYGPDYAGVRIEQPVRRSISIPIIAEFLRLVNRS